MTTGDVERDLNDELPIERQLLSLHEKYKGHTMIPAGPFVANLLLTHDYRTVPGCVVECGVWRGGMCAAMAEVLGTEREYFLFDSFEGLPPVTDEDGPAAAAWQADKTSPGYHDNCRAEQAYAEEAMRMAGAARSHFVKGWFNRTLPAFTPPSKIAVLRLDSDWYESTMSCLESLVPHVDPDGIVIVDDYYTWDGCARAVHDYLSRTQLPARIREAYGVCYLRVGEAR